MSTADKVSLLVTKLLCLSFCIRVYTLSQKLWTGTLDIKRELSIHQRELENKVDQEDKSSLFNLVYVATIYSHD